VLSSNVNDRQQLFTLSVGLTINHSFSAQEAGLPTVFSLHTLRIAFDFTFTRMLMSRERELSAFSTN